MPEPGGTSRRDPGSRPSVPERAAAVAAATLPVLGAFWLSVQAFPGWAMNLVDPLLLAAVLAPLALWRLRRWMPCVWDLVVVSVALGVLSVATGWFNGLTDEGNVVPQFATLLPNLYGSQLHPLNYWQYGTLEHPAISYCIYLPGLILAYAPLPWATTWAVRAYALAFWLLGIYLVRRSPTALFLMGGPYAAVIAANGFNDLVVTTLLAFGFVTLQGVRGKWAQLVAMGFKQPANVLAFAYWAVRRDWWMTAGTVGATALWLLPFFVLSPGGTVCHAILLSNNPSCAGSGGLLTHVNYYLYACWTLAIFGPKLHRVLSSEPYAPYRKRASRRLEQVLRWRSPSPCWVLLLAGWYSLRGAPGRAPRMAVLLLVLTGSAVLTAFLFLLPGAL